MDSRPVGMFDSGVGGLSVAGAFRELAPAERVIYFADTAYFPYGPRPAAEVRKRAFAITHRLLRDDVKLIVVACNTASAAAIVELRRAFPVPFVGMVPGLKPAAAGSRSKHVVILATPGTIEGGLFTRVLEEFGREARVDTVAGHGLAEAVEAGLAAAPETVASVRDLLAGPVRAGADTVVLGCTHYTFLRPALLAAYPALQVIDTNGAVARRAAQVLCEADLLAPAGRPGGLDLIVSGDAVAFRRTAVSLGFAGEGVKL